MAGHLGEPYGATQASHLPPPPHLLEAGMVLGPVTHPWPAPSDRHTPAAVPASPPACPLPLPHWPQITITRWHAALLLSPPFFLDTLTCPNPILLHHAGDKREKWRRQKAGRSLPLDLSVLI